MMMCPARLTSLKQRLCDTTRCGWAVMTLKAIKPENRDLQQSQFASSASRTSGSKRPGRLKLLDLGRDGLSNVQSRQGDCAK